MIIYIGKSMYVDPKRKVGSQNETPTMRRDSPTKITVTGYHNYSLEFQNGELPKLISEHYKFDAVAEVVTQMAGQGCRTMIDMGCNTGIYTFLAFSKGITHSYCLDHDPECYEVMRKILEIDNSLSKRISFKKYSFGEPLNVPPVDFLLCGAFVHWVFNLTSEFRCLNKIVRELASHVKKGGMLIMEWVDPSDSAIVNFQHTKRRAAPTDGKYDRTAFEDALNDIGSVVDIVPTKRRTRTLYIVRLYCSDETVPHPTFFKQCLLDKQGLTSITTRSDCGRYVSKIVTKYLEYDVYQRELRALKMLNKHNISWAPRLVNMCVSANTLTMEFAGEPLVPSMVLGDPVLRNYLTQQFEQILSDMKRLHLEHCDISQGELLLRSDGKLMLCDFGWAKLNGSHSFGCGLWDGKKPAGYLDDAKGAMRCFS